MEKSARDITAEGRHAYALAQILAGNGAKAIATLEQVAQPARTSAMWNDLAAAYITVADQDDAPELYKSALVAVDRALSLAPTSTGPLFNRALVIEELGLRDAARKAWQHLVAIETDSSWSNEATQHLAHLNRHTRDFRRELDLSYQLLARGDATTASTLTATFPQETRTWGESEILGRWAEASLNGDESEAARHYSVARALAQALAARNREMLLLTTIDQLDKASSANRATIAKAFSIYLQGRIAYSRQEPGEAESNLREAAGLFEHASSPMALVAHYFVANTVFDQYRQEEARKELDVLIARIPREFPALRAQVLWEIGLCDFAAARWHSAEVRFAESASIFDALGEHRNAAFLRALLGDVHQRLGAHRKAWRELPDAINDLSLARDGSRFRGAVSCLVRSAMLEHDWEAAASFSSLELETSTPQTPDELYVDALLRRSLIALKRGDAMSAETFVQDAASALRSIGDPSLRTRLDADLQFATAQLRRSASPRIAIQQLTVAFDFHQARGRRMYLPEILLARSRAHRASNDRKAAWADLARAIDLLETERNESPSGYARVAIFDSTREVFTEAVLAQIAEDNVASAFAYADRFRGRVLLDSVGVAMGSPSLARTESIPAGTALVEYLVLPDRLLIFVVRRSEAKYVVVNVSADSLKKRSLHFVKTASLGQSNDAQLAGADLYTSLIGPLKPLIDDVSTLIVVPDAPLQQIPWAALFDRENNQYLIERRALVVAPSAVVYATASLRQNKRAALSDPRVLVVGAPERDDVERLKSAAGEASAVAALYRGSRLLDGKDATRAAFLHGLAAAEIVHFAGHAVAPVAGPNAALFFADDQGETTLYADDLSRLRLKYTLLVVLAGCSTAAGEMHDGEGAWSMARSFMSAGVPSVVATLWQIDDEQSVDLFVRLHTHIRNGASAAEAVRLSQIEAIQRGLSISMWGAVQVNGS